MKINTMIIVLMAAGILTSTTGCRETQVKSATAEQTSASREVQQDADSADNTKLTTQTQERETITEWDNRFLVYTNFIMQIKSPSDCLFSYRIHKYGELQTPPESVNPVFDLENFKYDDVKDARRKSLGKKYVEFEQQIDALITAMDEFKPTLEALDRYAKSREYLVDKGVYLKAQNAKFEAQAQAFANAYNGVATSLYGVDGLWDVQRKSWIDMVKMAGLRRLAAPHEIRLIEYEIMEQFYDYEEIIEFAEIEDTELTNNLIADNTQIKEFIGKKAEELKHVVDDMHIENAKVQDKYTDSYNKLEDAALKMIGACRQFAVSFDPSSFDESAFNEIFNTDIDSLSPSLKPLLKALKEDESYNRALDEIYIPTNM